MDATIDVFANPIGYANLPLAPPHRQAHGGLKFFISYESGTLRGIHPEALREIQNMPSYVNM